MTATAPAVNGSQPLLLRESLLPNPFAQFESWFQDASRAPGLASAMSLATTGPDGRPLVRTVLLKSYDEDGFVFFTDLNTRKVAHISSNPAVSLLFPWLNLNRQVIITGTARRLSALGAAKSFFFAQNAGFSAKAAVEKQWEEIKKRAASGTFSLAPAFGAFSVAPESFEFWQGRGRPGEHDRFLYSRSGSGQWTISDLP